MVPSTHFRRTCIVHSPIAAHEIYPMYTIIRLLLATGFLIGSFSLFAQPAEEWSSSYGGEGFEEGQSLTLSPDGGFVMVGR